MFREFFSAVGALTLLLSGTSHADPVQALAEQYGKLPSRSGLDLSPNGRYVASRYPLEGVYAVRIDDLTGENSPVVWRAGNGYDLNYFRWTGKNELLVLTEKLDVTTSYSVDPESSKRQLYYDFFQKQRPMVISPRGKIISELTFNRLGAIRSYTFLANPEFVTSELPVFVNTESRDNKGEKFAPATAILSDGTHDFTRGPKERTGVFSYFGDNLGKVAFASHREFGETDETLWRRKGDRWEKLKTEVLDRYNIISALDDDKVVVLGGGVTAVYSIEQDRITETLDESNGSVRIVYTPDHRRIAGLVKGGDRTTVTWLDDAEQARHAAAEAAIGMSGLIPMDTSHDGATRLLARQGASEITRYFVWDEATGEAREMGAARPQLESVAHAEVQLIKYKARDGLDIEGYLTVPVGTEAGTTPLIVMPHGGPAARDSRERFDYWRQYLASLGYSVFQPNFRGSSGYGGRFAWAGYREWGGAMQTDIVDGVAALVERGMADQDRLAILGASYGGYAALMGGLDETPYRCVVSIAGVSDLPGMLSVGQISTSFGYWSRHIGKNELSEKELISRSPSRRTDEYTMPVLLVHGDADLVVRKVQASAFAKAMQKNKKDLTELYLPRSNHYFMVEPERIELLASFGKFLKGCNPTN